MNIERLNGPAEFPFAEPIPGNHQISGARKFNNQCCAASVHAFRNGLQTFPFRVITECSPPLPRVSTYRGSPKSGGAGSRCVAPTYSLSRDGRGAGLDQERERTEALLQPPLSAMDICVRHRQDTRHTHAAVCLMAGMNPEFIANQLGRSVQMPLCTYAKRLNSTSDWSELQKLETSRLVRNWYRKTLDPPLGRAIRGPCWHHATFPYKIAPSP